MKKIVALLLACVMLLGLAACAAFDEYYEQFDCASIAQIANYWTPAQALGTEILSGAANKDNIQAKLDQLVNDVTSSLVG